MTGARSVVKYRAVHDAQYDAALASLLAQVTIRAGRFDRLRAWLRSVLGNLLHGRRHELNWHPYEYWFWSC